MRWCALGLGLAVMAARAASAAQDVPAGASDVAAQCPPTPAAAGDALLLPQVAEALRPNGRLNVLAVGSATVLGPRNSVEGSFPDYMAERLRAEAPWARIELTVLGGRGLTASEMVATLRREMARRTYQLVLWQTGTVEAVRALAPEDFRQTLMEGVDVVRAGGGDLVLIDPQFSRFLRANANLDPYEQTMRHVASSPGVTLFRRFDIMEHWVSDDEIDLERARRGERHRTLDRLNACLGVALAEQVLHASGRAGATQ